MNNHAANVKKLNERLKSAPATRVRIPDSGKRMRVGQLWTVPGLNADDPGWLFLVLEELKPGLFNAVPCFRWTEWAGPSDLFLPRELAGSTLIVSFESESTVSREMLDSCCERLPQQAIDYVLRARATMDDPVERQAFSWGLDYFGRHCVRLARHEAIHAHIETLQAPLRGKIFQQIPECAPQPKKKGSVIVKGPFSAKSFPIHTLAIAAGLCLLVGIGGYLGIRHMMPLDTRPVAMYYEIEPDRTQLAPAYGTGMFRLARFRSPPPEPLPLYDSANPPVAYLFDATGQVSITRSETVPAEHACFILQPADIITAERGSGATIIHGDAVYFLTNAANYHITGEGILLDGRDELPVSGTLVAGAFLPPTNLLDPAEVLEEAAVHVDVPAAVLSPRGATYSQTPRIVWLGSDRKTYEVAIEALFDNYDSVRELVFDPQQVHGAVLRWADTGWPPLPRSSSWRVIIRHNGNIVSDPENSFTILPKESAEHLTRKRVEINDLLPPGHARVFSKALLMLNADPSCAAEARLRATDLRISAPNNIAYLKLFQHAYASMGFRQAVKQIGSQIESILNELRRLTNDANCRGSIESNHK